MIPADPLVARARERQARALQTAEELVVAVRGRKRGKSRTQLAVETGLGYDQYLRYVNGETPIRVEQIGLFARAYDLDPDVLGQAIVTGDTSELVAESWDFRAELAAAAPDRPDMAEQLWRENLDQSESDQRAIVAALREQQAYDAAHPTDVSPRRATGT